MILADTSVWIDYLRGVEPRLQALLMDGQVVMHPFIAAELALGSLQNRKAKLRMLDSLLQTPVAQLEHVRQMIEAQQLYSRGIGLTDVHLVASCLLTPGVRLWTRDERLRAVAFQLGVQADLP